jgi:hypothetical protein
VQAVPWRPVIVLALFVPVLAGCGGASHSHSQTTTTASVTSPRTTSTQTSAQQAAAVVLDARGSLIATVAGDGPISAAAADRRGGWYVAGSFTRLAGRSARGLAHLLANGSVDPTWHAALPSSGDTALAASADAVYAAGSIGDTNTSALLALDPTTGSMGPPLRRRPGPITALALTGGKLIVGTSGSSGAQGSTCVTALDAKTGRAARGFRVAVRMQPELGCAGPMTVDGERLYLAGSFQSVDGTRRPGLARIDATTGALDAGWRPPAASCALPGQPRGASGCDGVTHAVAVVKGLVLVAGSRPGVSALSDRTGATESGWRAPAGIENALALAVIGGRLFVGGDFTLSGGTALAGLATLSAADGSLLASWHPPAGLSAAAVVSSGSEVLVGLHSSR